MGSVATSGAAHHRKLREKIWEATVRWFRDFPRENNNYRKFVFVLSTKNFFQWIHKSIQKIIIKSNISLFDGHLDQKTTLNNKRNEKKRARKKPKKFIKVAKRYVFIADVMIKNEVEFK